MGKRKALNYEQLGTKIDPDMAEVLNAVCDSLQVDVYHLLQWFSYTVIRAASPMHRMDARVEKIMTLLESDSGWQNAFNQANPDALRVAQVILILEQDKHKGYGAVMIDKPFMSDARQTECCDEILERVCEVTMRGIYRRLRLMGAKMDCNNLSDVLLTMIDSQTTLELEEGFRNELPGFGDIVYGRQLAYGKKTKAHHHRTPDSVALDQRLKFNDEDKEVNDGRP